MDYEKKPFAVGPWGGQSGINWDDGVCSSVRQIIITYGAGIDSIQIEYDKQGSSVWSGKHGGTGGFKTDKVRLNYPNEFLTSIHGYYGHLYDGGQLCVRSLTFVSNERTHGPFGVTLGTFFSLPLVGHKIVGFYGRCGWFLDAIGAYVKPIEQGNESKAMVNTQSYSNGIENHGYSIIRGSIGKDYDILLAIKQKENLSQAPPGLTTGHSNKSPVITFPKQSSSSSSSSSESESSDDESKTKVQALPSPTVKKLNVPSDVVTHGPWGGTGGTVFNDGAHTGIKQIYLSRNIGIVYIRVLYDKNGQFIWGSRDGGTGGFKTDKIVIDYPYEILTHITGFYGTSIVGPTIVKSLTFHTTKGKHGPYGEELGIPFSSKLNEGMIVGFHGKKGLFLDAIGVHVKEGKVTPHVRPPPPVHDDGKIAAVKELDPLWPSKQIVANGAPYEEANHKVTKEPAPCGPGPWGGDGGKEWDDGVYTGIKQIFVTRVDVICSIQIEYDRNGQSVWSVKHGGNTGTNTHRIKLEFPHESLTCISGYYGPRSMDDPSKVIKSLTFYTSRGKYGPYGEELGTFFTSMTTEGKVVGFHGRSGSYLDAIGIHMQHWLGNYKQPKSTFFKMFG